MKNKINEKISNDQTVNDQRNHNKMNSDQIDKMLAEQYAAETRILESALLKAAGKTSWDEFPKESEEKIQEGYERLVARLKEKGEYRESTSESEVLEVRERFNRCEHEWNRTHRFLKPAVAAIAAVMITALAGMAVTADHQPLNMTVQAYQTSIPEEK